VLDHGAELGLFVAYHKLTLKLVPVLENSLLTPDFGETSLELIHIDSILILALDAVHHVSTSRLLSKDFGLLLLQSVQLALNIWVVEIEHI